MLNRIAVRRVLLSLAVALWLVHAGSAQQQPSSGSSSSTPPPSQQPQEQPQTPPPTFREGINFVRVDVIVTEKGEPVTSLTQADFDVREDGKPQTIEQFRLVRVDGRPKPGDPPMRQIRNRDDEEAEAARDDVRVMVIFLDDYHTRQVTALSVKQPLSEFVQNQLQPNDLVAVMSPLTPVSDVSFTRNRESIISAINNFEGRKYRYMPRNQFEEQYSQQSSEVVEQIRNQVVMGALRGLATRLGAVREGRKAVIYVSEGLTVMLPPQLRVQNAELQGGMPNGVGPLAGENNGREDTQRGFAQAELYSQMRDVFTVMNRNNTAIYALDPRGLATGEFGIDENVGPQQDRVSLSNTQDTLRSLAEETDGRAIVNRNDLGKGLQQVVRDSSFYYLIGYNSSQSPTDGKFHEIKVTVKRRGVDVRARRGYWAASVDDVMRATGRGTAAAPSKAVTTALASIAPSPKANQYVRTWIGTERGTNGKTRVTLVWEPMAQPAGVRRDQPGRVSVLAASASGEVVFRGRAPDQPLASAAPATGGSSPGIGAGVTASMVAGPQRLSFDAPPGELELRLSVEGVAGGVLDNEIRKMVVPDLTAPQPFISTPRVHRARTARDVQVLSRDASAVPTVVREFSRTDRVLIRFDAYGVGSESPAASATLLNRNGQKMADVPVAVASAGGTHQIDLGLSSVPAGEYLVEIVVKSSAGEVKELVPVRVTS